MFLMTMVAACSVKCINDNIQVNDKNHINIIRVRGKQDDIYYFNTCNRQFTITIMRVMTATKISTVCKKHILQHLFCLYCKRLLFEIISFYQNLCLVKFLLSLLLIFEVVQEA